MEILSELYRRNQLHWFTLCFPICFENTFPLKNVTVCNTEWKRKIYEMLHRKPLSVFFYLQEFPTTKDMTEAWQKGWYRNQQYYTFLNGNKLSSQAFWNTRFWQLTQEKLQKACNCHHIIVLFKVSISITIKACSELLDNTLTSIHSEYTLIVKTYKASIQCITSLGLKFIYGS